MSEIRERVVKELLDLPDDTNNAQYVLRVASEGLDNKIQEYHDRFRSGINTGYVNGLQEASAFLLNIAMELKEKELHD